MVGASRILVAVVAVFCVGASARGDGPPRLEVGVEFPRLDLPSMTDGRPMSMARFRGQKVMLHVFASW